MDCGAGTAGGTGHVIEFAGSVFRELSVEARMSVGLRRSCPRPLPPARPRACACACTRALSGCSVGQVCNMAIEAGARAGMVAPDEKTFECE